MTKIAKRLTDLIGSTPLLEVEIYSKAYGLEIPIIVKLEAFNPSGSVKARAALSMIESAERSALLTTKSTIIEPTSGNTGIALATVAAIKGYRLILTAPRKYRQTHCGTTT